MGLTTQIYISFYLTHIHFNCIYLNTKADRKVRFPYLLKINSNIYFQNQIHNMKA